MTPLHRLLKERIAREGPISLHDYMEASLGHPDYGYYNRQQPFGREGDFTTAPEISQMFGELIGLWCADVWMKLGSPMKFHLVELGPGNGTLMADLLRSAKLVPPFLAAANLHLVEMSDRLRSRQSETLAGTPLTWHDELPEVEDAPVILIANEFFDALPIHSYERKESDWYERLVTYEDDALFFILADQPSVLSAPETAKDGDIFEACPLGEKMLGRIGRLLKEQKGAALLIDYGPSENEIGDSFQALRAHEFTDPLANPGEADLTAHVKFPALVRQVTAMGLSCHGPTPQGRFLERLGIEARAMLLSKNATEAQKKKLRGELLRLTSAEEMGTLFKALALTHGLTAAPEGFGG